MLQSFTLSADRVVHVVGDFLRYDNETQVAIRVRADGQDFGLLWPGEAIELPAPVDFWEIKGAADGVPASGTLRVGIGRIRTSRRAQTHRPPVLFMESGVNQVAAGGGPGWVSGDTALLPASTLADVAFDLGPDWPQYGLATVGVMSAAPATQFASVQIYGCDSPAVLSYRRLGHAFASNASVLFVNTITSAGGVAEIQVRPKGRYVILRAVNDASGLQGSGSKITLTAFPS